MATVNDVLLQIIDLIKKSNDRLTKIEKRLGGLEKNMEKVLNTVSAENADEFPALKRTNSSSRSTSSVAAKSK